MHTLENHGTAQTHTAEQPTSQQKQARIMRVALGLLLTALLVVGVKNWGFWSDFFFPEEQVTDSAPATPPTTTTATAVPSQSVSQSAPVIPRHNRAKHAPAIRPAHTGTVISPVVTASSRRVLPPLEIDVVAGNHHQTVQASKRSVQVDMQGATTEPQTSPSQVSSTQGDGITSAAVDRVVVSPGASVVVSRQVEPNYPVLAKQMKVQGAVILQALIGKGGSIQNLRVLSGPAILSEAAREAVKQWHFKPYLLAGQPVETEARITVNFTISTD
jgi:TonB family protein